MPAACRLGDKCSGHGSYPPRPNDSASGDVFVNNKGLHRKGDHWVTHSNGGSHDGNLAAGSGTVFANGKQAGRIGDPISCGSTVAQGSGNVFIGG